MFFVVSQGARDAKLETARNAFRMNLSEEQVMQLTGLSLEEVEQIKEAAAK